MAISGHKQLATLQQYVKPSQDAVAKLMAATDPDRRRRVTPSDRCHPGYAATWASVAVSQR
jgi:hypothetical protein